MRIYRHLRGAVTTIRHRSPCSRMCGMGIYTPVKSESHTGSPPLMRYQEPIPCGFNQSTDNLTPCFSLDLQNNFCTNRTRLAVRLHCQAIFRQDYYQRKESRHESATSTDNSLRVSGEHPLDSVVTQRRDNYYHSPPFQCNSETAATHGLRGLGVMCDRGSQATMSEDFNGSCI